MKVTLNDIARKCKVSTTTASRVLSGKSKEYRINKDTAAKIQAEASRCGYIAQHLARSLRNGKTNTIALLVPTVSDPFFAEIASTVIMQASQRQYTTIVLDTMESKDNEEAELTAMVTRKVDGIIVAPSSTDNALFESIYKEHTPIVLIDRYLEDTSLPYVTSNNFNGGYEGTKHLVGLGHKRIACIQGASESMPNKRRVLGYMQCMKDNGLDDFICVVGNAFSVQNGYAESKLLLGREDRPTAIFSLSSTINLGALKAIHESGLEIPRDISVITFDSNRYLDFMTPTITRVEQSNGDLASVAVKMLMDLMDNGDNRTGVSQIQLSTRLVVRDSTGKLATLQ